MLPNRTPLKKITKAQTGAQEWFSVVLILAAVGYQGRPQSVGCCLELGHKEGRNCSTGL